jgi:hypothetical protein
MLNFRSKFILYHYNALVSTVDSNVQAYEQFLELDETWGQIMVTNTKDAWKLIWGADNFSKKRLIDT